MGLQHREAMHSTRGTAKMKAREIVISAYDLDSPESFNRGDAVTFIQEVVKAISTHEKGGYLWGKFSTAKDPVSLSPSYCVSLLHMGSRKNYTTVGTLPWPGSLPTHISTRRMQKVLPILRKVGTRSPTL